MTIFNYRLIIAVLFFSITMNAQEKKQLDWDALQESKPWETTEVYTNVAKVSPGINQAAPSDAIVLYDGNHTDQWQKPAMDITANMELIIQELELLPTNHKGDAIEWEINDNSELVVSPGTGNIATKRAFGDVQLHIEWLSPTDEGKSGQQYSNSGVFFMGLYEVQVLNSYQNNTYSNGQAGSVYKQYPPLVNASTPPDTWQTYDIIFMAPRFSASGNLIHPARLTVLHNGVLVQNNVALLGPTVFIGSPYYVPHPDKMPLMLQDHGDKVRFRNIWIREL